VAIFFYLIIIQIFYYRKLQKNQVDNDLVESFENLKIPSNDEEEEEDGEHFVKLNDCYAPINFPIKSCKSFFFAIISS